jgi:outer membrane immunogenic protein
MKRAVAKRYDAEFGTLRRIRRQWVHKAPLTHLEFIMSIRSIALASVAAVALSTGALAADLPMRGAAPAPVYAAAPIFTWTGLYVGVNGGYAGDKFDYPFSTPVLGGIAGSASINSSGFTAGGTIGYNWQFGGGWVVGIEGDYNWANVEGKLNAGINGLGNIEAGSELTSFGTARLRLGYGFDRALVYVTGGYAYGRTKSSLVANFGGGGFGISSSDSNSGWTVGAGMEYALTNNVSFKTEYLYVDLGDQNLITTGAPLNFRLDVETKAHVVRAGINYRFWSPAGGAVVARY